ncbi:hypothetical protein [Empedobacter falsenii]|uniref:Uncharacterized protein n=1 Tax=Empedobacter falsenii TaxID=343874 RepID=A0A427BT41_9FLAO|nr:hypothetical protein [Empedobacter falsenii]RRT94188.1 hypothetical protein EGI89_02135 [Empedobacter falsenii]RRT94382.1 hypothetical protein EGI88_02140 [Empedobacter falsenii]
MIKKIIQLIKERKLLNQQYWEIKFLSSPKDFNKNLEIYNLIKIYNRRTYKWSIIDVNYLFNNLLKRSLNSTDLYMTFIFKYEKENQGEILQIKNLLQVIRNTKYDYSSIHDLRVEMIERINQIKKH